MQLLYYLFAEKNVLPGDFYKRPPGERLIVAAFFEREMEGRK